MNAVIGSPGGGGGAQPQCGSGGVGGTKDIIIGAGAGGNAGQ